MTVSAENMLMPLSVFIEGHLFISFLEQELGSGIDFECFIEWPPVECTQIRRLDRS